MGSGVRFLKRLELPDPERSIVKRPNFPEQISEQALIFFFLLQAHFEKKLALSKSNNKRLGSHQYVLKITPGSNLTNTNMDYGEYFKIHSNASKNSLAQQITSQKGNVILNHFESYL